MKSREVSAHKNYVLRLERGEDVLPVIVAFCTAQGVQGGFFSALGAVERIKLGYYDLGKKAYGHKEYAEAHEVASMTGNIALVEGVPFVHCHAVLSSMAPGAENVALGGHIFEAKVAVTLEVHLVAFGGSLLRTHNGSVGLKLLDL